jgi:hypothetical protein
MTKQKITEIMKKLDPLESYWNFTLAAEIMRNDKVTFTHKKAFKRHLKALNFV